MTATLTLLLSALLASAAGIRLDWNHSLSTNVLGYRIYWGTEHGQFQYRSSTGYRTNWSSYGFQAGVTYHFVVTATNQSAESEYSNEADCTVSTNARPDPITITATMLASTNGSGWSNYVEWPEVVVPAEGQEHLFRGPSPHSNSRKLK